MSISKKALLDVLGVFKTMLDDNYFQVFAAGASGIVPAPTANDADKFLRGDGQWATPTVILGSVSSTVDGAFWLEDDT